MSALKPYRIVRAPAVAADLWSIFSTIADHSEESALRFLDAADRCFQQIAASPGIGTVGEFASPMLAGVRRWRIAEFPNYLVFYRLHEDAVEILHVMHGARNISELGAD
jgi:toxin ParE1/3/4